jgi:hypothetical protein
MTTTPDEHSPDGSAQQDGGAPGAEVGMTEGEGSTFEPEEDPEAHSGS